MWVAWFVVALGLAGEPEGEDLFAPTMGETFEVVATLRMDPVAQGKALQGTWLVLDDGQRWIVSYRPVPEWYALQAKRVSARGQRYQPSPNVAHISAPHARVDALELAPDEVPHDPTPSGVLPPPTIEGMDALRAATGEWALAVGVLEQWMQQEGWSAVPFEEGLHERDVSFHTGLRMGAERVVLEAVRGADATWTALDKQVVTVLGRVVTRDDSVVVVAFATCPAVAPRCGLPDSE